VARASARLAVFFLVVCVGASASETAMLEIAQPTLHTTWPLMSERDARCGVLLCEEGRQVLQGVSISLHVCICGYIYKYIYCILCSL
jgi:hypothetical protein